MYKYKLPVLEKVGFGAGDMAVNVVISSMMLIITFFYTDIFGIKPEDLAMLFIVVRLIDAVTDPLMGMITDKFTSRWGRYRQYLLFLAIPFGVSVYLAFSTPDGDYNTKLVYAYATYILITVMFTAVTIPYISLISVMTDDPKERLSANGYRLFFAKIAAFLVTIIVPQLSTAWGQDNIQLGYQYSMGLMGTLLFLFCFATTKERIEHVVDKKSFKDQVKLLMRNDQWLVLCAVCVTGTISAFLATGVGAAILAMVASTWITKKYCKIKLFRYSQVSVLLLSLMLYVFVGREDLALAFVLYFLVSFVVDLHAPVFWSAIAEAVDYGAYKTGQRVSGLAFGGISFSQKLGMGIGGAVVGWLLTYFNYVPNEAQSDYALTGIALMLTVIPGFFHFLMGSLMSKYKVTDKYYQSMTAANIQGGKKNLSEVQPSKPQTSFEN
ncbi:sodium:galactoside symporter [Vibrio kanaloae]|uniref:MFS transporter n=1 Tax=Vibrio kanaloae TaxID=170673 RepID=UPI000C84FB18|nr:MFS transporter [Vibrio kanaloae]PMM05363.1 sodium:galactoside symporter [Vibrio kanaloae]